MPIITICCICTHTYKKRGVNYTTNSPGPLVRGPPTMQNMVAKFLLMSAIMEIQAEIEELQSKQEAIQMECDYWDSL